MLCASAPSTPLAPLTSINTGSVELDWLAPNNGGSPITAYKIDEQYAPLAHKDETRAAAVSQTEEASTSPTAHTIAELGAAPALGAVTHKDEAKHHD